MSKILLLILIILITLIFIINYLYNEGIKLSKSGKEYCEEYPENSVYTCPYGKEYCKPKNFLETILCPLNNAIFSEKAFNWGEALNNPKLFYNSVYFIENKEKVNTVINYKSDFSKFQIELNNGNGSQEIYTNNSETPDNITHLIKIIKDSDNLKNYIAVSYSFFTSFVIDISKTESNITKLNYKEFRNLLHTLKLEINDSIKTKERLSDDLKKKVIFFDYPNGIINVINVVRRVIIPKLDKVINFNYYTILKDKILTNYQLSLVELIFYISYSINEEETFLDSNKEIQIILKEYFF